MELYKKYRPKRIADVVGQEHVTSALKEYFKSKSVPHAILFHGPSGCGKTTLGRIVGRKLRCSSFDMIEINAASSRGIDTIRQIENQSSLQPMDSKHRLWIIDECHELTSNAQSAFLKILEDCPEQSYFVLCTTDPQKLKKTIRNRCTEFGLKPIPSGKIKELVERVLEKEGMSISSEVVDEICDASAGSARKSLVLLDAVLQTEDEEEQLRIIQTSDEKTQAIELARVLINPRSRWPDAAKVLKNIEGEPETIRHIILSYATSVLLGGGKMASRAYKIICCFEDNFYDSKKAGLVASSYAVFQ